MPSAGVFNSFLWSCLPLRNFRRRRHLLNNIFRYDRLLNLPFPVCERLFIHYPYLWFRARFDRLIRSLTGFLRSRRPFGRSCRCRQMRNSTSWCGRLRRNFLGSDRQLRLHRNSLRRCRLHRTDNISSRGSLRRNVLWCSKTPNDFLARWRLLVRYLRSHVGQFRLMRSCNNFLR